jgi:CPA1 family monovalent cation:H+ antiporter
VQFLLENVVFLLIGLQASRIVREAGASGSGWATVVAICAVVFAVVLLVRPLWIFLVRVPAMHLGWLQLGADSPRKNAIVLSWAGMRGVVTLAAAFALPGRTPYREVLILAALVVSAGTLLLQGSTLPALARRLDVHGPDPREDALQEATVLGATTGAGLRLIEADARADEATVAAIRVQATNRVNRSWERLGTLGPGDDETPSEARARVRTEMIQEERAELLRIRDRGGVDHEVLTSVLGQLDAEESALIWNATRSGAVRESLLRPPDRIVGACEHLAAAETPKPPTSAEGCPTCLAEGLTWVHLRSCAECGNVGCCDSSVGQHAEAHFHETGHPVMRSIEPGEAWLWCYVDEVLG